MSKAKGKKTIICGSRNLDDYELLKRAIETSGFEISEVVSGGAKGADSLGEKYAKENKIKIKQFKAQWENLDLPGAVIKSRKNPWTKKEEQYCSNAGPIRNEEMAVYCEGEQCIAIPADDSIGTKDMINRAKNHNINTFIYKEEKKDTDFEYFF